MTHFRFPREKAGQEALLQSVDAVGRSKVRRFGWPRSGLGEEAKLAQAERKEGMWDNKLGRWPISVQKTSR